jgi:hypothetical protein
MVVTADGSRQCEELEEIIKIVCGPEPAFRLRFPTRKTRTKTTTTPLPNLLKRVQSHYNVQLVLHGSQMSTEIWGWPTAWFVGPCSNVAAAQGIPIATVVLAAMDRARQGTARAIDILTDRTYWDVRLGAMSPAVSTGQHEDKAERDAEGRAEDACLQCIALRRAVGRRTIAIRRDAPAECSSPSSRGVSNDLRKEERSKQRRMQHQRREERSKQRRMQHQRRSKMRVGAFAQPSCTRSVA